MIACEHPSILVNPYVNSLLYKAHGRITFRGSVIFRHLQDAPPSCHLIQDYFHYFSPRKHHITPSVADDYRIVFQDGTFSPLYLLVPCGHCRLCEHRKMKDWQTRGLCECATSNGLLPFVRLSYNDKHLPLGGDLCKEDVQAFLKRLRNYLSRAGGDISRLRYCYCGEYGGDRGRAHYHVQFFNWPTLPPDENIRVASRLNQNGKLERYRYYELSSSGCHSGQMASEYEQILFYIERAWSACPADVNPRARCFEKDEHFESLGFCHLRFGTGDTIKYVMKYINKQTNMTKFGYVPPFFESSRGSSGGLGSQYLKENMNFFLEHPEQLNFTLINPLTGKSETRGFPLYFKLKIFATLSTLVPKVIRDAYNRYKEIEFTLRHEGFDINNYLGERHSFIERIFSFMPLSNVILFKKVDDSPIWFQAKYECPPTLLPQPLRVRFETLRSAYVLGLVDEFLELQKKLVTYKDLLSDVCRRLSITEQHKHFCEMWTLDHPYTHENLLNDIEKYEKDMLKLRLKQHDEQ